MRDGRKRENEDQSERSVKMERIERKGEMIEKRENEERHWRLVKKEIMRRESSLKMDRLRMSQESGENGKNEERSEKTERMKLDMRDWRTQIK